MTSQHKTFEGIDANRDGVIDRAEWEPIEKRAFDATALIDKRYNSTSNPDDITRLFSEYDADSNGSVTFQELNKGLCQS